MRHLLTADVVVALPGGVGTLGEAAGLGGGADRARRGPAGAGGRGLGRVRRAVGAGLVVDADDLALAHCVATVDDVVDAIKKALSAEKENRGPRG